MKKVVHTFVQVLNLFFVLLTLLIAAIAILKREWIETALTWIESFVQGLGQWNYLIIFFTSVLESFPFLGVVIPGMNVMILVAGFFIGKDVVVFGICFGIAALGACLGNATGFLLGKFAGREFLQKYGAWFGIGMTEMRYIEHIMKRKGFWFIVGGKFHGMLRAFIPYIAGAAKMNTRSFWLYNCVGAVIWSASILLVGVFFIENYEVILKYFGWIVVGSLVLIAAYMLKFQKDKLASYFREKNDELEALGKRK